MEIKTFLLGGMRMTIRCGGMRVRELSGDDL
jgi:hypothetical protein